jgi:hypothetical protein
LQEFLGSIPGVIVHHGERERERRIQTLEEAGQLTYALQGVVVDRYKRNINRHEELSPRDWRNGSAS